MPVSDERQREILARDYTRDEAQDLVERASDALEYGPDYSRSIADAAADVLDALTRGRSIQHPAAVLALRLECREAQKEPSR